ncbi:MAG TPA: hypothetical protein VHQ86_00740 [Candidatus Saccharimonadia bacterium]|jgi:hypothetical protein|nr:hypothetical protein [Candidatus Saccharimonadia bacterium]
MARRRFGATRQTPGSLGQLLQLPEVRVTLLCEVAALLVLGLVAAR